MFKRTLLIAVAAVGLCAASSAMAGGGHHGGGHHGGGWHGGGHGWHGGYGHRGWGHRGWGGGYGGYVPSSYVGGGDCYFERRIRNGYVQRVKVCSDY
jgi:hypothetical protein